MEKHKPSTSSLQIDSSNDTAQYFVVPPEILAQLGITLGSSQNSEVVIEPVTSQAKDIKQSIGHNNAVRAKNEDTSSSSIIETANLMKESVFLSPTFFQTPSIVTQDEEEPMAIDESAANTNTKTSSECGTLSHQCNMSCVTVTEINSTGEQSKTKLLHENAVINPSTGMQIEKVIDINTHKSIKEYQVENRDRNIILTDLPYQNLESINICNGKSAAVDDHPDEAYLSDCSNSYSGCSPESLNSEVSKHKITHMNKKVSKDKKHDVQNMDVICSSTDTLLTPVTTDSIITEQLCHSNVSNEAKEQSTVTSNKCIIDTPETDTRNSKSRQDISLNNVITGKLDKHSSNKINISKVTLDDSSVFYSNDHINANNEHKSIKIMDDSQFAYDTHERNSNVLQKEKKKEKKSTGEIVNSIDTKSRIRKTIADPTEIDTQNKVKEIATYLSQIANTRKNIIRNNNENMAKKGKIGPIRSKLCIQGVEKPGGLIIQEDKMDSLRVSKTYQRPYIIKQPIPSKITLFDLQMPSDSFQLTSDQDATEVIALKRQNEFCICFDYGNLTYYDCEMLYEHIHFWQHNSIECDSQTLFSMYTENDEFIKQNVDFVEDGHHMEQYTTIHNSLCWHEINFPENNEESNVRELRDSKLSRKDSFCGRKTVSVPKMDSVTTSEPTSSTKNTQRPINIINLKMEKTESSDIDKTSINTSSYIVELPQTSLEKDKKISPTMSRARRSCNSDLVESAETTHIHIVTNKTPKSTTFTKVKSVKKDKVSKRQEKLNATQEDSEKRSTSKITDVITDAPPYTKPSVNTVEIELEPIKSSKSNEKQITPKSSKRPLKTTENYHSPKRSTSKTTKTDVITDAPPYTQPSVNTIEIELEPIKNANSNQKQRTPKSVKRTLNTTENYCSPKKAKTIQSAKDGEEHNQNLLQVKASRSKHNEVAKVIKSEKSFNMSEITDIADNDNSNITTLNTSASRITMEDDSMCNADTSPPNDSIEITFEDSELIDNTLNDTTSTNNDTLIAPMQIPPKDSVTCGVCKKSIMNSQWQEHSWKEHDYLAWRDCDDPLDLQDEIQVKKYLQALGQRIDGLVCSRCNLKRKNAKTFLSHIERCIHPKPCENEINATDTQEAEKESANSSRKSHGKNKNIMYTCGVCNESVQITDWIEHIRVKHKYLAWTSEETPLNLDDEADVKQHLNYISKNYGGLICENCDSKWSYVKKYLQHIRECKEREATDKSIVKAEKSRISREIKLNIPPIVTCGACNMEVEGKDWIKHIQVAHEYMALIGGENPINLDDPIEVKQHLDMIVRATGELTCMKCGERRKNAFTYLQHRKACLLTGFDMNDSLTPQVSVDFGKYVCGVCLEVGSIDKWKDHAMSKHYNIAWMAGEIPINLRNPYSVEKYLKEYKKKHGLTCKNCNESRASTYGFYAHILTCGKTQEEIDGVMNVCEVCNNKYLCIYRNQHLAAHRDTEMRREKKEQMALLDAEKAKKALQPEPELMGKRRAAERAKKVIKKHSSNMINGKPECDCGAIFKNETEYAAHSCSQKKNSEDSDSDESVKMELESGVSDDEDEEIEDSLISDEEEDARRTTRVRAVESANKLLRMTYSVTNYTAYLTEAYKDFVALHYTAENLFNIWRNCDYQIVPPQETAKYLPQVIESCKIRFSTKVWTTYKRFEAKKSPGYSFFTGGATQCIAWAPHNLNDESLGNYLAISCHRGPDVPRYSAGERPHYPASLQIWDFQQFDTLPRCVLCIAHEYGIVWCMDWCPSGARDAASAGPRDRSSAHSVPRLGLLAIACSNGTAYILAVPQPPRDCAQQEPPMYKLKPVAELRLTMTAERRIYQTTSIKWSQQKGHSIIIVGYSDGTTALFDLNTESPFLATTENGVTIYYPFQDRRAESSSITGVGLLTTTNEWYAVGGEFSASMTGGTLAGRTARPTARCHLAASGAHHAAHWPAATLAGDLPFMRGISEMEWWGGGRRAGAGRAWAACARCGRAASAAPPALRTHVHHPAYPEIKKLICALLVMVPLNQPRKRQVNDDLSVVLEPLTYDVAVEKYGLQLNMVHKSRPQQGLAHKVCNSNEYSPDRFPLSDIVALAYCPAARFHDKLAMATHTGLMFILST